MGSPEGNILTAMFGIHVNDTDNLLPITQTLNAVAVSINLLLGLPLHICVIWLIINGNGVASELFTLNMAAVEILSSLGVIVYPIANQSLLECGYFFTVFLFIARPLFQTCICLERYLAVLEPVLFLKYKPLRYRLVISTLGWVIALTCSCVSAFLNLHNIMLLLFTVNSSLVLLMLFCSLIILKALTEPGPGQGRRKVEGTNQAKLKAFKIILALLLSQLFYIILGISGVATLLSRVDYKVKVLYYSTVFFTMIFTGFTQPLLYLHAAGKLQCKPTLTNTH